MENGDMSDDESIDVENYSDSDEAGQNVRKTTVAEKSDEKAMGSESNGALNKNADLGKKDKMNNILYGIVHKLFSARVVLKRLSSPEIKKLARSHKHVKKPIKRLKIKKANHTELCFDIPKAKQVNSVLNSKMSYTCEHCKKQFIYLVWLKKHLLKCKAPTEINQVNSVFNSYTSYTCDHCKRQFTYLAWLKKHLLKCKAPPETAFIHEGNAYMRICPKCRKPPARRKTQHCLSCETALVYECQKCHKQYGNYKLLLLHIDSKCFIRGYYHCPVCDYKTLAPSKVKSHVVRLHPSVKYDKKALKWSSAKEFTLHECSQCAKQFDSHESLNMHIPLCNKAQELMDATAGETIRVNKDFQKMIIRFCPKCDKITEVYDSGVSSLQPCHQCGSSMKFKCSQCRKQYGHYTGVAYHTKLCFDIPKPKQVKSVFSSKRNYTCKHCEKQFIHLVWLKRHLLKCKARHERKPRTNYKHLKSVCKNCDKAQNICDRRKICVDCQSNLHFQCKTCNENFTADVEGWCEHLKTHFGRVKYECDNCGAGLISRELLSRHMQTCMEGSEFCCDLCTFTTKIRSSLYRHMVFVHPVLK